MPYKDPIKRRERHRQYMKEVWYPKNRKKHIAMQRKRKVELKDRIAEYKLSHGCKDCGYNKCAEALDFDHVNGDKEKDISNAVALGWKWERLMAEISKCDVVCANCHRERTAKRRGG